MLWCLAVVGNAHGCLIPNLSSSAPRGRSRASTTHSAGDSSRARRDFPPSRESLSAYFVSGTEALMMALIVVVEDAGLKSRPSSRSTPWVPPRNFVRAATCARDSPRRVRATTRSACASSAFDVALKFKSSARAFDGGFECAVNVRRGDGLAKFLANANLALDVRAVGGSSSLRAFASPDFSTSSSSAPCNILNASNGFTGVPMDHDCDVGAAKPESSRVVTLCRNSNPKSLCTLPSSNSASLVSECALTVA